MLKKGKRWRSKLGLQQDNWKMSNCGNDRLGDCRALFQEDNHVGRFQQFYFSDFYVLGTFQVAAIRVDLISSSQEYHDVIDERS